jgi:hypothetical protein
MRAIEAAGIALAPVQSGAIARRIVVPGTIVPHAGRIVGVELHQARLIILAASIGIRFAGNAPTGDMAAEYTVLTEHTGQMAKT